MDYKNYNKIDSESEDNVIYKKKYKKLKRLVKDLVFVSTFFNYMIKMISI